jgi:chemotaxis methyl-accepting protein methylase
MQVSFMPQNNFTFGSNSSYYCAENGNSVGTYTKLFRPDLDWEWFTEFLVKNFREKDNVNFIQFGSSDGSEAYTQIITLLDRFYDKDVKKFFPIEAYDINEDIYNSAKSGIINIYDYEKKSFENRNINFNRYFQPTEETCLIQGEIPEGSHSYKASKDLTSRVSFHCADMVDILRNLKDDSNTVILCRNLLYYLSDRDVDFFTTMLACRLKKGSVFVTGGIDRPNVDEMLQAKGFIRMMPNVYRQT